MKPVSGTVRTEAGEPFTSGGLIEFRHTTDYKKRSTASIDQEGRFTLSTGDAQSRHPGAYAGEYRVAVYRAVSFDKLPVTQPVTIPPEGTTELEIVVGRPAP